MDSFPQQKLLYIEPFPTCVWSGRFSLSLSFFLSLFSFFPLSLFSVAFTLFILSHLAPLLMDFLSQFLFSTRVFFYSKVTTYYEDCQNDLFKIWEREKVLLNLYRGQLYSLLLLLLLLYKNRKYLKKEEGKGRRTGAFCRRTLLSLFIFILLSQCDEICDWGVLALRGANRGEEEWRRTRPPMLTNRNVFQPSWRLHGDWSNDNY